MKKQNSLRWCNLVTLPVFLTTINMPNPKRCTVICNILLLVNLEFLENFTYTFDANLPSIYYPTLNVTYPNVSLIKSIYFNCFYDLMFLSIESQGESNFPRESLRLQGGLNQLSFPLSEESTLGAYKVLVQKESGEKIKHSFEVNEYGKNSAHIKRYL